jgi:hypothetical protein
MMPTAMMRPYKRLPYYGAQQQPAAPFFFQSFPYEKPFFFQFP